MAVGDGVTVTAARCGFMKNGEVGVFCGGANTKARLNDCKVHHNGSDGLAAFTCNTLLCNTKVPGYL